MITCVCDASASWIHGFQIQKLTRGQSRRCRNSLKQFQTPRPPSPRSASLREKCEVQSGSELPAGIWKNISIFIRDRPVWKCRHWNDVFFDSNRIAEVAFSFEELA